MAPRPRRQPQQNDAAGRNRQAQAAPPLAERSCDRRVRSALPHKADTFAAAIYGPGDPRTAWLPRGARPRVFTPSAINTIRGLAGQGKSASEIAEVIGSTTRRVQVKCSQLKIKLRRHAGLPRGARPRVFTPSTINTIRGLAGQGKSASEIAEVIGSTTGSVRVRCSQLKIKLGQGQRGA